MKTGHGGIRDIEFVIQFLQLLNGGDLPATSHRQHAGSDRAAGAVRLPDQSGAGRCWSENYSFLRKIEHRLQIMFDLQTHLLPAEPAELRKLALRMGYADLPDKPALEAFLADYREKTVAQSQDPRPPAARRLRRRRQTEPEVDLVLDPDPPAGADRRGARQATTSAT